MNSKGLVAAVLLAAVVVASPGEAADTTPFELDVIMPLTGQAGFAGAAEHRGLNALEVLINSEGGIRGRPLKFVYHDDGTNPQTVIQLTNELAAKHPAVILGAGLAVECAAQFPLVEDNGPVTFCFSPSVRQPKHGGYSFRTGPVLSETQPTILNYYKRRGFHNFAVITSTDASGQDFDVTLDQTLLRPDMRDVKIVAHEHFNVTDLSVAAQMARIKAAKPDVLLTFSTGPPFGTLLHGIADAGLDVPIYGSGGNLNLTTMKQYASLLPKELVFNGVRGTIPDPTATGKMREAQQTYFDALKKVGATPDYTLLIVWDPAMVVVDALRKVGPDATAQQLHEYLEHLKGWTGVLGTYDFTDGNQRGVPASAAALFRWDGATSDWVQVAPTSGRRR